MVCLFVCFLDRRQKVWFYFSDIMMYCLNQTTTTNPTGGIEQSYFELYMKPMADKYSMLTETQGIFSVGEVNRCSFQASF